MSESMYNILGLIVMGVVMYFFGLWQGRKIWRKND